MKEKVIINVEYRRVVDYVEGESDKVFGDDYFEWDESKMGELTLSNIVDYIVDNEERLLSYSEDDVIDFSRGDMISETLLLFDMISHTTYNSDEDEIGYQDYNKEEIEKTY